MSGPLAAQLHVNRNVTSKIMILTFLWARRAPSFSWIQLVSSVPYAEHATELSLTGGSRWRLAESQSRKGSILDKSVLPRGFIILLIAVADIERETTAEA